MEIIKNKSLKQKSSQVNTENPDQGFMNKTSENTYKIYYINL